MGGGLYLEAAAEGSQGSISLPLSHLRSRQVHHVQLAQSSGACTMEQDSDISDSFMDYRSTQNVRQTC